MTQRRADASHNRIKLLDAAEAVFLDHGVDASLDLIAVRAGVGRATLFRNFSDRNALILGLLDRTISEIECEARELGDHPLTLVRLLRFVADRMIYRAPIVGYWRTLDQTSAAFVEARERMVSIFDAPVRRAVMEGTCRADLRSTDILLLITMLGGGLYAPTAELRGELAVRAWMFVVEMAQLERGEPPPPDGFSVGISGQPSRSIVP